METTVQSLLHSGAQLTDAALERLLPSPDILPHSIHRAMRHSTFAGGKRLRPILCMEAARMVSSQTSIPEAAAIDTAIELLISDPSTLPDGVEELGAVVQLLASHPSTLPKGADELGAAIEMLISNSSTLPTRADELGAGIEMLISHPSTLPKGADELGAAIEMLHTYSLIHDDLPSLDNDDLRRGQPTCHIIFGEAIAILAGDALQTLAFQTIAALPTPPATTVAILREISLAIGSGIGRFGDLDTALPPGMIGGQVMDIESEGRSPSERNTLSEETRRQHPTAALVESIHRAKTGALITTSLVAGGLLGLSTQPDLPQHQIDDAIARLRTFGENAGLAFQIVDDVLDMTQDSAQLGKTAGKDTASIKATWPAIYGPEIGIAQSLKDAGQLIADAFEALTPFGEAATPLKSLARYLVERKS